MRSTRCRKVPDHWPVQLDGRSHGSLRGNRGHAKQPTVGGLLALVEERFGLREVVDLALLTGGP
jgi:hypothetical protein